MHPTNMQPAAGRQCQTEVNKYFQSSASYWNDIYFDRRLWPTIYRERQSVALQWIESLDLPSSARILEIGCGAGFLSIALARKGYSVVAMDSTAAMLESAQEHASQSDVAQQIHFVLGDVHELPVGTSGCDLIVALGVIPWLHSEWTALDEMKRALKTGGHLLMTADNEARLNRLLDPVSCPLLDMPRSAAKWVRAKAFSSQTPLGFQPKRHNPMQVDRLIETIGLSKVQATTIGFGVLTLAGKQLVPDRIAVRIHRKLQSLANRNVFPFNQTGIHYMVLSRKKTGS